MRHQHRRGTTILEVLVWAALVALILGAGTGLWVVAGHGARLTSEHDSAQLAAFQALEAIRRDAERMVFIDPAHHLGLSDDRRTLEVKRMVLGDNPWSVTGPTIRFSLRQPRGKRYRELVRAVEGGATTVIRTGPLDDVRFTYHARSGTRPRLTVVVVAMASEVSPVRAVATGAISIPAFEPYHHYVLSLKGD